MTLRPSRTALARLAAGFALAAAGCRGAGGPAATPAAGGGAGGAAAPGAGDVAPGGGAADPTPVSVLGGPPAERRVPVVKAEYPHDPTAFTQGLLLDDGRLYESTGLEGASSLREVDLESGNVVRRHDLSADIFAEGLALVGDQLWQITWQEQRAFVYDQATFEPVGEHAYAGEGWGLCWDGARLVMSDGSDTLTFRDPDTFAPAGAVAVTLDGRPLGMLNELECVDGLVYANVWQSNQIVAIDAATGRVTTAIDAASLWERMLDRDASTPIDVLNGIAHDPADGTFLVTGKWWPKLFRVRFEPAPPATPPSS